MRSILRDSPEMRAHKDVHCGFTYNTEKLETKVHQRDPIKLWLIALEAQNSVSKD